jgi:hypothetical protein
MMTQTTKTTLNYETKTCGRCGGSGRYSYNTMHGSVCYGCSGRKTVLTRAGAKAQKLVAEFIAANYWVLAGDVKVGDVVRYDGVARTVKSVTEPRPGGSSSSTVNGETVTVYHQCVDIEFTKPIKSQFGAYSTVVVPTTTVLIRGVSGADWQRVVEFARTIKRGIVVVEQ